LLAHDLQCVIVSVDYRLAPEVRYPGAVEDCYAALLWVHRQADALSIDPDRIAMGGDSAGGGLAAALAIVARDRAEVSVVLQLLVYPMLDDRTGSSGSVSPYAGEFVWDKGSNVFAWQSYLGATPGGDNTPKYAAPARVPDLSGLPPAFVIVGQLDLFVDEDIDYARRLIAAGVPTQLQVYPGAFHGFDLAAGARIADSFRQMVRTILRRAFEHGTGSVRIESTREAVVSG
jgi:triacylglycerol lipase